MHTVHTPLRVVMAVVTLALLAIAPPHAAAQATDYGKLGLSPDQMRQVRELQQEINQRLSALESQLREQRRALEAVYAAYELDTARARQINTRINEIQLAILDQNLRLQAGLRRILTEEQFGRLQTMMQQHRPRFRERRGPPQR